MLVQEEIWKDVKGYEGYYKVSNMGRVLSVDRTILKRNGVEARISRKIIKPTPNKTTGPMVALSKDSKVRPVSYRSLLKKHFGENYQIIDQASIYEAPKDETFVPVRGYEGIYEISQKGTIRSVGRRVIKSIGGTREVADRIKNHNFGVVCLSSSNSRHVTRAVPQLLMESFIPSYDPKIHKTVKVKGDGKSVDCYQYFTRLEHNPIMEVSPSGEVTKFNNYKGLCKKYGMSTDSTAFLRNFFFKEVHINTQITKGVNVDGYTYIFDHPVFFKGETKMIKVFCKTPSINKSR